LATLEMKQGVTMRRRCSWIVSVVAIAIVLAAVVPVAGQGPITGAPPPTRTPWGHPGLQGVWNFNSNTPLEDARPGLELGPRHPGRCARP
jgi:hypothetical protein